METYVEFAVVATILSLLALHKYSVSCGWFSSLVLMWLWLWWWWWWWWLLLLLLLLLPLPGLLFLLHVVWFVVHWCCCCCCCWTLCCTKLKYTINDIISKTPHTGPLICRKTMTLLIRKKNTSVRPSTTHLSGPVAVWIIALFPGEKTKIMIQHHHPLPQIFI